LFFGDGGPGESLARFVVVYVSSAAMNGEVWYRIMSLSSAGMLLNVSCEVWKESFDWKYCETADFACQKFLYIHNNPFSGKWNLADDSTKYEYSSAC
jgi:hypothetical protein